MRPFVTLLALLAAPLAAQPYVVNQGNFSSGDGSVTRLSLYTTDGPAQLFEGQLGAILQSGLEVGGELYLLANTADRIEVVSTTTNARVAQITGGFSGPRYAALVNDGTKKAYVTNQVYGGPSFVLPVDLDDRTTGTAIPVDGNPEGVVWARDRNKAYVALGAFGPGNGAKDSLAVIDPQTDMLMGYVDVGCYARFVATPGFDYVLAFCEDTDEAVVVDTETDVIVQRLGFGEDIGDPFGIGQSVGPGIIPIATRQMGPPSQSFVVITASGVAEVFFSGTAGAPFQIERTIPIADADTRPISAVSLFGHLVLGRPDPDNPFTADGTITVHDYDTGALLDTYAAGIYPTHIVIAEDFGTAAENGAEAARLGLALAGPHPVRQRTTLALTLDRPATVRAVLLDVLGRTVATLEDGPRGAGESRVEVDASGLAPGLYLVRVVADGRAASLPLTVAR